MTKPAHRSLSLWRKTRRAIRLWWRTWQWLLVAGLFVAGITLGTIGYASYFAQTEGLRRSILDSIYHSLQLTALQFTMLDRRLHWTLQVARFLLPAVAAYAAVKAVVALYSEQLQNLRVRLLFRDHTVVCGLGQRGLLLAKRLRERGERVVVIEHDTENDLACAARDAGAVVLFGDATEESILRRAGVYRARDLVSVCDDDGLNAEIAVQAHALTDNRNSRLHCICHVDGSRLRGLIERHQRDSASVGTTRLTFFSVYETGAQVLLRLDPPFSNDVPGVGPHFVIVGVGRMGESLLVRLAQQWQEKRGAAGTKLRITLVDRLADGKRDFLRSEYPDLADVWELEPTRVEVKSPEFQAGAFLDDASWRSVARAYVCFDDDALGLTAALRIESQARQRGRQIPVVLRTRQDHGLAVLLPSVDDAKCPPVCLRAFGLLDHACKPDAVIARR